MANAQNIQAKAAQVEEISKKIANAQSVIVFDYRGLNAEEVTNLRSDMRKAGVEYVVLKNHIVSRAARAAGIDDSFHTMLKGPNAYAFGMEDAVAPAKVIYDFISKNKKEKENLSVKVGLMGTEVMDEAAVKALSELPSREVLLSRMLGSMMSPISGLAIVLDQIAKKGENAAE